MPNEPNHAAALEWARDRKCEAGPGYNYHYADSVLDNTARCILDLHEQLEQAKAALAKAPCEWILKDESGLYSGGAIVSPRAFPPRCGTCAPCKARAGLNKEPIIHFNEGKSGQRAAIAKGELNKEKVDGKD